MPEESGAGAAAPVSGGGGAAPTSSAPAAPSSAPSSSAPATPASTDVAAETGSAPLEGESSVQTLQRVMAANAKEPEAKPEDKPAEQPVEKPAEQPVDDKPKVDGEEKPTEAEATEDDEPFTLEDAPEPTIGPRELSKKIAASPEMKAALDKDPALKDAIYAASRIATKAKDVLELIPDKETAMSVVQSADEFAELSGMFLDATDLQKTGAFLQRLQEYDTLRGEDGKPLVDERGRPQSSGAVGRFLDYTLDTAFQYWGAVAKQLKDNPNASDEDLARADRISDGIEAIQTERGRGPRSAAKNGEVPEHIRQREADLNSREETLRRSETERFAAKEQEFETTVRRGIESSLQTAIKSYLDQCDLEGLNADTIAKAIERRVYGTLKDSIRFRGERDRMMLNPMNDKTQRDRVALAMRWAKPLLKNAAREALKAAGARLKAKQDGARQKADAGQQASRSEPRSGGAPPAPQGPMSTEQLLDMAETEAKAAKGGIQPSTAEIYQALAQIKQRLAVR